MSKTDDTIVQLCGPVTGLPQEEAVAAFDRAERMLYDCSNCEVISPVKVVPADWSHERAMRRCLRLLLTNAEALVTLDGWEVSAGARLEVAVARAIGMEVMTLEEAVS